MHDSWPSLLAEHTEIPGRLIEAYGEPGRGYHDLQHLAEVLDRIAEILGSDPQTDRVDRDAVVLAAWFHDAVYEAARDDEERSAVLAEQELTHAGASSVLVDEVARLVRLTAGHRPGDEDGNGQVLCDADLAILAARPDRYREYVAGVRREHAHLSDQDFRAGRATVLRDLIAKPTLFHTRFALQHWENDARVNVERELRELGSD